MAYQDSLEYFLLEYKQLINSTKSYVNLSNFASVMGLTSLWKILDCHSCGKPEHLWNCRKPSSCMRYRSITANMETQGVNWQSSWTSSGDKTHRADSAQPRKRPIPGRYAEPCKPPVFALQEVIFQIMRASTDIQPRRGLPPMVSEFATIITQPAGNPIPPLARKLSIAHPHKHCTPPPGVTNASDQQPSRQPRHIQDTRRVCEGSNINRTPHSIAFNVPWWNNRGNLEVHKIGTQKYCPRKNWRN